jgi:hypothetical protein
MINVGKRWGLGYQEITGKAGRNTLFKDPASNKDQRWRLLFYIALFCRAVFDDTQDYFLISMPEMKKSLF